MVTPPLAATNGAGFPAIQHHYDVVTSNTEIAIVIYFSGVALVALGSAYYHEDPENETLFWDRLPMTIAFMALFARWYWVG